MEKRKPSCTVGGNVIWYSHYGRQYGDALKKLRIKLPYDPVILLDIYPEKTITEKDKYTERLYFWGSKITADGDCSHGIKRLWLLERKVMTNLDSILKSRDISLLIKIHLVKTMVFPVGTDGCESWTVKKVERQRIDDFELWGWRRLLRVPWTARRSNQSILQEISCEYSLEGLMLKLKLHLMVNTLVTWCEELTYWKRPWCWERSKAGGEGDDRGWDGWMVSPMWWTWVWVDSRSWWWTGKPGVLQSVGSQRIRHDWATELNWPLQCSLQHYLQ